MENMKGDFRVQFAQLDKTSLIDAHEFAAVARVSVETIYAWRKAGRLPPAALVTNRVIRWQVGAVRDWLSGLRSEHQGPVPRETKNLGRPRKVRSAQ